MYGLVNQQPGRHKKTYQKRQSTQHPKKVHGLFAKTAHKQNGQQIQKAVYKPFQSKLALAKLTGSVFHHFFAYAVKTGRFRNNRNVAVHISVHFYVFHYLVAVGLQTAVHVVQFNATQFAVGVIKQFRGQVFGQCVVVAFLFPATHQVKTLLLNHLVQLGYFIGTVLQIGIHGNDYIASGLFKTHIQGGTFAVVAPKANPPNSGVLAAQFLNNFP